MKSLAFPTTQQMTLKCTMATATLKLSHTNKHCKKTFVHDDSDTTLSPSSKVETYHVHVIGISVNFMLIFDSTYQSPQQLVHNDAMHTAHIMLL